MENDQSEIENRKAGEIISKAREAKGWTQTVFAEILGVSSKQLRKYEQGKFPKYKRELVEKIDTKLGTSVSELLREQNVPRGAMSPAQENPDENTPGSLQARLLNELEDKKEIIRLLKERDQLHLSLKSLVEVLQSIQSDLSKMKDYVFGDTKQQGGRESEVVLRYKSESRHRAAGRKSGT